MTLNLNNVVLQILIVNQIWCHLICNMFLHCDFHCEKTGKTEVSNNTSNNKNTELDWHKVYIPSDF